MRESNNCIPWIQIDCFWSLSRTDSSLFNISNTGGLSFSSADYEAPLDDGANNEYNLL